MRFRPLHVCQTAALALVVLACLAALLLVGACRTAGHKVCIRDSRDIDVTIRAAGVVATQGKAVPVKALSDISAAASQSGDAAAELTDESAQTATDSPAPAPAGDQEANPPVAGGESASPSPSPSPSVPSVPSVDNPTPASGE